MSFILYLSSWYNKKLLKNKEQRLQTHFDFYLYNGYNNNLQIFLFSC